MNSFRKQRAIEKRREAALLASMRPHPRHISNADEQKFRHKKEKEICRHKHYKGKETSMVEHTIDLKGMPSYLMSFTKGLPHDFKSGLVLDPQHFQYFVWAIDSGDPRDFRDTPLGPNGHMGEAYGYHLEKEDWKSKKAKGKKGENPAGLRAWESQSAGLAFDLEGPDAQAVTMPPAPRLGSDELTAEIAEVYAQALLRDTPFHAFSAGVIEQKHLKDDCSGKNNYGHECHEIPLIGISNKPELDKLHTKNSDVKKILKITEELKRLAWFSKKELKLNSHEEARRCMRQCPHPATAFRGITPGDDVGPYLSQFLLIGNAGINSIDQERDPADGQISYGAISIDQKVRNAKPINYMTKWEEWFDVQNAADVSKLEAYFQAGEAEPQRIFIHTPRDLATYVHYDALYEAYLNACIILIGKGVPFDPGIPFRENDQRDHQQGFAHFGGPHILSLVTEVATRALKAVRFQKYNIHRRCRPEVLAARITKAGMLGDMAPELEVMQNQIGLHSGSILDQIDNANGSLHESGSSSGKNYLLPMAFCEGSPMHPSYGAGHATVAGACVTVLKAFFDCKTQFKPDGENSDRAYVSVDDGKKLDWIPVFNRCGEKAHLTVEGELNKLASNISIGRDWAGVHYFSDYYESLLMGEQIAIGILEEQKTMFQENFSMTVPMFNGDSIRI